MQTQKDKIRQLILLVARDEFLSNGVKHTSMKNIADKAGIAVGNIYNYYRGKDELLRAVLAPLLKAFEEFRKQNTSNLYTTIDIFKYETFYNIMQEQVASLIVPYRKEMRLLLFECAGTSLEKFLDRHFESQMADGELFIQKMKCKYPYINADVSAHFMRILCRMWNEVLKEIAIHENISQQETNLLISNYVRFDMGGWKNIMGIDDNI